jgi:hypothetical protein
VQKEHIAVKFERGDPRQTVTARIGGSGRFCPERAIDRCPEVSIRSSGGTYRDLFRAALISSSVLLLFLARAALTIYGVNLDVFPEGGRSTTPKELGQELTREGQKVLAWPNQSVAFPVAKIFLPSDNSS